MITRKEMGYVNDWPNKIPYPGEEYCVKTLQKLKRCFELYNKKYLNRKYTIQFSNNEEIDFAIEEKNLSHILGVDYKNLMKDIFDWYRENILYVDPYTPISSYALLSQIIESIDSILEYDRSNRACMGLNYYRIGIKCDIFSKLSDLSKFNYGCINFSKDKYDRQFPDKTLYSQSTKFLYTPSDEVISPYFMMGIKPDNNTLEEKFIVETLIACDDPEKFFSGQEVVIPTQILTDDNGILDKKIASPSEKLKLLRIYQSIVNELGIENAINIYGDYYALLMSQREDSHQLILQQQEKK